MNNTLLCGYTDWIDQTFLSGAFPEDHCVCVGQGDGLTNGRQLRLVDREDLKDTGDLQTLLGTWVFHQVVFFSRSLEFLTDMPFDELRFLSGLLDVIAAERGVRVMILTGVNRQHVGAPMEEQLLGASLERMRQTCRTLDHNVIFIQCPWIYNVDPKRSDIGLEKRIREARRDGRPLSFPLPAAQEIRMLSRDDLAELLRRICDRWVGEDDTREFVIGTPMTCRELGDALEKAVPGLSCSYDNTRSVLALPGQDAFAREKYAAVPSLLICPGTR